MCYDLFGKLADGEQELLQSSPLTGNMIYSKGFETLCNTLTGLYFSLFILSSFLKAGVTSAFFRSTGNGDSEIASLIIGRRVLESIRINLGGCPSKPLAIFLLICFSLSSRLSSVIG